MYQVIKRDGKVVDFNISKIADAMKKAFEATGTEYNDDIIDFMALKVSADYLPKIKDGKIAVEDIQDSVEAVLSRGDRRVADAIEEVWRQGGRLDAWTDYFSFERWMKAFEKTGLDVDFYACRERSVDELLPWDMIDVGVRKEHLVHEREMCYRSELSPDCRRQCSACGAARLLKGGRCDG